jgi:hypothetical protein
MPFIQTNWTDRIIVQRTLTLTPQGGCCQVESSPVHRTAQGQRMAVQRRWLTDHSAVHVGFNFTHYALCQNVCLG